MQITDSLELGHIVVETSSTISKQDGGNIETISSRNTSVLKLIRQNLRLSICGVSLATVAILNGYESSFVSGIAGLPAFRLVFGVPDDLSNGNYIIPSLWLSLWSVSPAIGTLIGSLLGGWSQDAIGRRWTLMLGGILQAGTVTISYLADQSPTVETRGAVYFIGKTAQGVAMAAIVCIAQAYISETLPSTIRASVVSLLAPFNIVGQAVGGLISKLEVKTLSPSAYRIPIAAQWIFSAIPLLLAAILPESPVWLMRKGRWTEAKRACRRLEGSAKADAVDNTYGRLRVDVMRESAENKEREEISYRDLFQQPVDTRRSMIAVFASTVPDLFGLQLLSHFTYFVELMGMSASQATLIFVIATVIGVVANLCAFYIMSRIGRRPLLIVTMAAITVLWAIVGVAGCFATPAVPFCVSVAMVLVLTLASLGAWPVSYAIQGEVSTLRLKGKTSGLSWFTSGLVSGIFNFILPYIYNPDAGNLGGKVGFLYATMAGLGALGAWLWVPEMKNRTPSELDELFRQKVSARKFHLY